MRYLGPALLSLAWAQYILIPMDQTQTQHLRAYGLVYGLLTKGIPVDWLLNYRGGSFAYLDLVGTELELQRRGIAYEKLSGTDYAAILTEIARPEVNMDVVRLEKAQIGRAHV